jgi:hypothetical protein
LRLTSPLPTRGDDILQNHFLIDGGGDDEITEVIEGELALGVDSITAISKTVDVLWHISGPLEETKSAHIVKVEDAHYARLAFITTQYEIDNNYQHKINGEGDVYIPVFNTPGTIDENVNPVPLIAWS